MSEEQESSRFQWHSVHWSEGMFLQPHHLQAAERHARDMLSASEEWYHPYAWGFRSILIDRDALQSRRFVLEGCEARFRDGSRLAIPEMGRPEPLPLDDRLVGRRGGVKVCLAIPRWRMREGRPNVGGETDGARYWVQNRDVEDENTGDNPQGVDFRRLRSRLILADTQVEGLITLPLARVVLSRQGVPRLHTGFVPPLLSMNAAPALLRRIQSMNHLISTRIDALIEALPASGRLYETEDTGEAERVLKLSTLNQAHAHLEALTGTPGMSPVVVFQELCRVAGGLAIFTPERRPRAVPNYRHHTPGKSFQQVLAAIRRGLDATAVSSYETRVFQGTLEELRAGVLSAEFKAEWVDRRTYYLGVRGVDSELTRDEWNEIRQELDMKLGGVSLASTAHEGRLRDFVLTPRDRPRVLPGGYLYFRIDADEPAWRDVAKNSALVIQVNPTRGRPDPGPAVSGARGAGSQIRVLVVRNRRISFALFVV